MQGQKGRQLFGIQGLRVQPKPQACLQKDLICDGQIPEIGAQEHHGIPEDAAAGLQHVRQAGAVAQKILQPLLPSVKAVENMLYPVEHPENIRILLNENDAAPVVKAGQIPVLPQAHQTHVFAEDRPLGEMVRGADVNPPLFEILLPVQVEFRTGEI